MMYKREEEMMEFLHKNYLSIMECEYKHPSKCMPNYCYLEENNFYAFMIKGEISPVDKDFSLDLLRQMNPQPIIWENVDINKAAALVFFKEEPDQICKLKLWFVLKKIEQMSSFNNLGIGGHFSTYKQMYVARNNYYSLEKLCQKNIDINSDNVRSIRKNIMELIKKGRLMQVPGFIKKLSEDMKSETERISLLPLVFEALNSYEEVPNIPDIDFENIKNNTSHVLFIWTRDLCLALERRLKDIDPIQRVCEMVDKDCTVNFSQISIAEGVGLSTPYFSKIFKERTGINFSDYIINKRIDLAKTKLLSYPNEQVHSVGADCGFSSDSYFIFVFRRRTGTTPSKFRRSFLDGK